MKLDGLPRKTITFKLYVLRCLFEIERSSVRVASARAVKGGILFIGVIESLDQSENLLVLKVMDPLQ